MSDWIFIIAAYGLTWITLAAYGAYVGRRASRAERALAEAEQTGGAS